jgi:hypothetical protein
MLFVGTARRCLATERRDMVRFVYGVQLRLRYVKEVK